MIIRNKKTKREYEMSAENWAKLRAMNRSNLYEVVSKDDKPQNNYRINIPKEIKEFQASLRIDTTLPKSKPNKTTKK